MDLSLSMLSLNEHRSSKEDFKCDTSTNHNDEQIPEQKNGGWGWAVVIAGMGFTSIKSSFERSFPLFYESIMDEYNVNYSQVSQILALYFISYGVLSICGHMLANRIGCRNCVMLLGTVASASCFVASLPGPFWKLVLCYGAVPGACLGIQMVCSHAAVNMYFPTKKSLAFQILLLGFGFGPLILGPAFAALIIEYTWNGALMIIAGVLFQVTAAGAVMRPLLRVNEAGALQPKIRIDDNKNELKQIKIVTNSSSGWLTYAKANFGLELFCHLTFYVNILQYLFHVLALYCSLSFLVPLATIRIGPVKASFLISAEAIGEIASKITCGILFSKIHHSKFKLIACFQYLVLAVLFVVLPWITSYPLLVATCAATGLFAGSLDGIFYQISAQMFGDHLYPSLVGYSATFCYGCATGATILIGHIVDITEDVSSAFYFGGSSYFLAAVVMFLLHKLTTDENNHR